MYVPPAELLKKILAKGENGHLVTIPTEAFLLLLSAAFEGTFDARWYRMVYPDVGKAVDKGELLSELDHFVRSGFWEGRMPCSFPVDEGWYKKHNADVCAAIEAGAVASAHMHFNKSGYFEGRAADEASSHIAASWSSVLAKLGQLGEVAG